MLNRISVSTSALTFLVYLLLSVPSCSNAQVIALLDAGGAADGSGQQLLDLSSGGNSLGAISAVFSFSAAPDFFIEQTGTGSWNVNEFGYDPDSTEVATWTFSNVPVGSSWEVFASWNNSAQGNLSQNAPYTVQGVSIGVNQEIGALAFQDLTLNDGNDDIQFASLGLAVVGADGNLVVTLSGTGPGTTDSGGDYVIADAIAIRSTNVPQPTLLGDVNLDGVVNFSDIPTFISVLQSGGFQAEADCDLSGTVDFGDIPAFIEILMSQ